jgi:hypothetical protein
MWLVAFETLEQEKGHDNASVSSNDLLVHKIG